MEVPSWMDGIYSTIPFKMDDLMVPIQGGAP